MKLVTHPGAYHTDDCLAVAFIQCIYSDIEVIRSTSPLDIANADFVVDVGGVYDYDTHRFDHHQQNFSAKYNVQQPTVMSASGLVFFHYGFQIIKKLFPNLEFSDIQFFMDYIYDNYMVCIDAVDNGVDAYKEDYLYQTSQLTLQSHVKKLNKYRDFDYACNYVFDDFKLFAQYSFDFVLPGASVLKHAVQNRFQVHSSGKAMLIMEDVMVDKLIKYQNGVEDILFQIIKKANDEFHIRGISSMPGLFRVKQKFPSNWCGLRGSLLEKACGFSNVIFCHKSGMLIICKGRQALNNILNIVCQ